MTRKRNKKGMWNNQTNLKYQLGWSARHKLESDLTEARNKEPDEVETSSVIVKKLLKGFIEKISYIVSQRGYWGNERKML